MKKLFRITLTALTVLIFSCTSKEDNSNNNPEKLKESKEAAELQAPAPDFTMTAEELYEQYNASEDAANAKYRFKTGQITGKVIRNEELLGQWFVDIEADSDVPNLATMSFLYSKDDRAMFEGVKPGDRVTVVGQVTGMSLGYSVKVTNCKLVKLPAH